MNNCRTPFRIFLFILLFSVIACSSFSINIFEDKEKWNLEKFNISPGWTKVESMVPVSLSGLPEKYPETFQLPVSIKPGNQGSQASGSAWAVGYLALSYHYQVKKNDSSYHCSPSFIYNQSVNGRNIGIEALQALDIIEESGCPDIKYMPFEELNLLQRPNMQSIEDASRHTIRGFARVDFTDVDQIKAHLIQNSVIITTIIISENFVTLDEYDWEYPSGKKVGVQTLGIIGYDDTKKVFLLQNSAGDEWGKDGRATISYNWYLRLAQKAYVIW